MSVIWFKGEREICSAVSDWLDDRDRPGTLFRDNPRRQVVCAQTLVGPLLIKLFKKTGKRNGFKEHVKALLRLEAASREFSSLDRMWKSNASIAPRPLALGRTNQNEGVLVSTFYQGQTLTEALMEKDCDRVALLSKVGKTIGAFHLAGMIHRDLHAENILVTPSNVLIVDLQSTIMLSRHLKTPNFSRTRDLGALNYSLWRHTTEDERRVLVSASIREESKALGSRSQKEAFLTTWGRKIERSAWRHFHRHARSRTKKAKSAGRRFSIASWKNLTGLKKQSLLQGDLEKILELHSESIYARDHNVIKDDQRSKITRIHLDQQTYVIKETSCRNVARGFTDNLRGSAARRAWRAAYGLEARNIRAPEAFAFVEERVVGIIRRSILILGELNEIISPLDLSQVDPQSCLNLVTESIMELHRKGVDHGDLKVTNYVFSGELDKPTQAIPVDLEQVKFHRKVAYSRRVEALAQLNASLPDSVDNKSREKAFETYCRIMPFRANGDPKVNHQAKNEIVSQSLKKQHRWTGRGCSLSSRQLR